MLRVPKIASKPNEVSVTLSFNNFCNSFGALKSKMTVFSSKMAAATRGTMEKKKKKTLQNFSDFTTKKPLPRFQYHFAPSPPSHSAECQVSSWTQFNFFFLFSFDFHVDVISKLCLSGSHCLCLTGRPNVLAFSGKKKKKKNHGHGHWLSC